MPETTPDVPPVDLSAEERALGQQHSPHRWYREDAVERIVATRVAAERAEWAERVAALVERWRQDRSEYPLNDPSASAAFAAVKLCGDELAALAQPAATEPGIAGERPYCLRCEVPIYRDEEGVWRREATGSNMCPRNPARDGHEPRPAAPSVPTEDRADAVIEAIEKTFLSQLPSAATALCAQEDVNAGLDALRERFETAEWRRSEQR